MKKLICLAVFLFCASFAMGANLTIAVSLPPYANIVKSIGGSRVNVVALIPPSADPHTFEPKPATLKEFAKADAYFSDGSGMDRAWLPRFLGANKNVKVFFLGNDVDWVMDRHHHHEAEASHHEELDPHIWTSPKQVMKIAQNVRKVLSSIDSSGRDYYSQRFSYFVNRIEKIDTRLARSARRLPKNQKTFVVFHPSFGYLANDYGLTQLSIEINGKEPKPKDLATVIVEAKKHNVHMVFVQPQFSKRSAETIAKQLDAVVMTIDPLDADFVKTLNYFADALDGVAKKKASKK